MIFQNHSNDELEKAGPTIFDLRIWEKAFELAAAVIRSAEKIPPDIGFGLSGQMRIVALSIPSYIARGQSRATSAEFLRGLYQARGALSVLNTRMKLCAELGFATQLEIRRLGTQLRELRRMIDLVIDDLRGVRGVGGPGPRLKAIPGPRRLPARSTA